MSDYEISSTKKTDVGGPFIARAIASRLMSVKTLLLLRLLNLKLSRIMKLKRRRAEQDEYDWGPRGLRI